jgi:hypothetical protein
MHDMDQEGDPLGHLGVGVAYHHTRKMAVCLVSIFETNLFGASKICCWCLMGGRLRVVGSRDLAWVRCWLGIVRDARLREQSQSTIDFSGCFLGPRKAGVAGLPSVRAGCYRVLITTTYPLIYFALVR